MLIQCSSCNSKYLVNSADLKPDGRTVQCVNCDNKWYQESIIEKKENFFSSVPSSKTHSSLQPEIDTPVINLPSTYVSEQKPSLINSIFVVVILFLGVAGIWLFKNYGTNLFVFIVFYVQEFFFNLKLITSDLAKIIHQIIN